MHTYSQLTQIQRYQIYVLLKMGHLQCEIATNLDVHKSTISREIQRNAKALQADVYFAYPQAAWERGSNENANGLIRQFFPKGTNFSNLKEEDISIVDMRLNHRPRKCLGFSSPYMVFFQGMRVALNT